MRSAISARYRLESQTPRKDPNSRIWTLVRCLLHRWQPAPYPGHPLSAEQAVFGWIAAFFKVLICPMVARSLGRTPEKLDYALGIDSNFWTARIQFLDWGHRIRGLDAAILFLTNGYKSLLHSRLHGERLSCSELARFLLLGIQLQDVSRNALGAWHVVSPGREWGSACRGGVVPRQAMFAGKRHLAPRKRGLVHPVEAERPKLGAGERGRRRGAPLFLIRRGVKTQRHRMAYKKRGCGPSRLLCILCRVRVVGPYACSFLQ